MIASRYGRSWQIIIADLSLILFMVTAAAMQRGGGKDETHVAPPLRGQALAVYRPARGAQKLDQWLAAQAPDERQRLTIVARYLPGHELQVAQEALALAAEADEPARIVIEPSATQEVLAVLAFDAEATGTPIAQAIP